MASTPNLRSKWAFRKNAGLDIDLVTVMIWLTKSP